MNIENWIDVFRQIETLRLGALWGEQNEQNEHLFPGVVTRHLSLEPSITIDHPNGLITEYGHAYKLAQKAHPAYPDFFMVRKGTHGRWAVEDGDLEVFRFGSLSFMWGRYEIKKGFKMFRFDTENNQNGFPSIVELKNGIFTVKNGVLCDSNLTPAVRAGFLMATWTDHEGVHARVNGPRSIDFRDYAEFWRGGVFRSYECANGTPVTRFHSGELEEMKHEEFVMRCNGRIQPLNNQFFESSVDEFEYLTEFSLD